jgi:neutral ceramidase
MIQFHDQKAGPSQPQPKKWTQERSRWQCQIIKAAVLVTALVLGYIAFMRLSHRAKSTWFWRLAGQGGDWNEHGSSNGSQYLLGVGKADITGLDATPLRSIINADKALGL